MRDECRKQQPEELLRHVTCENPVAHKKGQSMLPMFTCLVIAGLKILTADIVVKFLYHKPGFG